VTAPLIIIRDPASPKHVHACITETPKGPSAHQWVCASPYCNHLERVCVAHGGPTPRIDD
jgi:hypothetical protein